MFATSGDVLKMSLALGVVVLTIFLSILIFYLILIARDVSKMTEDAEAVVHKVKKTIIKPLSVVDYVLTKVQPIIESVFEKQQQDDE